MAEPLRPDRRRIAVGAAVIVLAGGMAWLATNLSWVDEEHDDGYGETARRNPFLAAELFLSDQGIEAETVRGLSLLDDLPETDDLLVVAGMRRALSERRLQNLIDWVESGGHLVVVARQPYDEEHPKRNDALLSHFGIQLIVPEEDDESEEDEQGEDERREDDDATHEGDADAQEDMGEGKGEVKGEGFDEDEHPGEGEDLAEGEALAEKSEEDGDPWFEIPESQDDLLPGCVLDYAILDLSHRDEGGDGGDDPLILGLDSTRLIWAQHGDGFTAYNPSGAQLVHRRFERGAITASTSLEIWTNDRIHCHDHAYLLRYLATESDKVWLLHDPAIPSLAELIGSHFPLTSAGAVALVLMWAAARGLRHGPSVSSRATERRELLEHLEASARFLWQHDLATSALGDLRQDIRLRSARRHGLRNPTAEETRRLVSEGGEYASEVLYAALDAPVPRRPRDFVQLMRTLQSIRRKL